MNNSKLSTSFGEASKMAILTAVIGTAIFIGVSTTLDRVNPPSRIKTPDWNTLKFRPLVFGRHEQSF